MRQRYWPIKNEMVKDQIIVIYNIKHRGVLKEEKQKFKTISQANTFINNLKTNHNLVGRPIMKIV